MDRTIIIFVLLGCISKGLALECYTCNNQEGNKDKCIKTTKQCLQSEDTCITYVNWGIPPYWTPHGDRIHFVSKDCSIRTSCEKLRYDKRLMCKRDWYDDWSCVECCTGDMCNYYATLGSSSVQSSLLLSIGVFLSGQFLLCSL